MCVYIVDAIVATDFKPSNGNETKMGLLTQDEIRNNDIVGLPVYLEFAKQHQVGTVASSTLLGEAWEVCIHIDITDERLETKRQFNERVMDSSCVKSDRLWQITYTTEYVFNKPVLNAIVKSLSFCHKSMHTGSTFTVAPE